MKLDQEIWRKNSDGALVWAGTNAANEPCTVAYLVGEEVDDDVLIEHGLAEDDEEEKAAPAPAKKAAAPPANKNVKGPAHNK